MQYRTLGKTGLEVSVVGLGGIPVQRTDREGAKEIVKACMERGINFLDTARAYSVSEEFFGEAIKPYRNQWIIATKSMPRDYEGMKADIETSLKNLQTDYIDLYQMHNLKSEEELKICFGENGAYRALVEAKEAGKIRHIGATAHKVEIFAKLLEDYADKIETFMFPYNIVESQGLELMAECEKKNIGFIAMKPLAGGNIDDAVLALKYILNTPECTIVIPGMGNVEEVKQNTSAAVFEPLTEEDKVACKAVVAELGNEFCRRCGYCAPCPKGIDISQSIMLANYKRKYGLSDWSDMRYAALAHKADECVKCGLCESRCPYELPIRKMLEQVVETMSQ